MFFRDFKFTVSHNIHSSTFLSLVSVYTFLKNSLTTGLIIFFKETKKWTQQTIPIFSWNILDIYTSTPPI